MRIVVIPELFVQVCEVGYEQEVNYKSFVIGNGVTDQFKDSEGPRMSKDAVDKTKSGEQPKAVKKCMLEGLEMGENDMAEANARLLWHKEESRKLSTALFYQNIKKFFISYRLLFFITVFHVVYSVCMWFLRDPLDRKIWPFQSKTIRASNFAWLSLVYSYGAMIWTYVYSACAAYSLMSEDMDDERMEIRSAIKDFSLKLVSVEQRSLKGAQKKSYKALKLNGEEIPLPLTLKSPAPLSYQHSQARSRYEDYKELYTNCTEFIPAANMMEGTIEEALHEGEEDSVAQMLDSEKSKIAAEAATMFVLLQWHRMLQREKNLENMYKFTSQVFGDEEKDMYSNYMTKHKESPPWMNPRDKEEFPSSQLKAVFDRTYKLASNEQKGEANAKFLAEQAMLGKVANWTLALVVKNAQGEAKKHHGLEKQQIAAVIMAVNMAYSFFSSKGLSKELDEPRMLACQRYAKQAAKKAEKRLTTEERKHLTEEDRFLGHKRDTEIEFIAAEELRWPGADLPSGLNERKIQSVSQYTVRNKNHTLAC